MVAAVGGRVAATVVFVVSHLPVAVAVALDAVAVLTRCRRLHSAVQIR